MVNAIRCEHGIKPMKNCKICMVKQSLIYKRRWRRKNPKASNECSKQYRDKHKKEKVDKQRKWRKFDKQKYHVYKKITANPEKYPLDFKCAFCDRIKKLEHGHLDYEDDGYNYLTVCHQCNLWMLNPIEQDFLDIAI